MMENLTKENFWNKMEEDYPLAMKKFKEWIDKYKEENDWEAIFAFHIYNGGVEREPKFHELPIAFQWGIWLQFWTEEVESTSLTARGIIEQDLESLEYDIVNFNE